MTWALPPAEGGPYDDALDAMMDAFFQPLAEGIEGQVVEHPNGTYELRGIRAVTEGSGHVGRFLDALPTNRDVLVPFVVSARLAGMLRRRGFHMDPLDPVNAHYFRPTRQGDTTGHDTG